MTIDLGRLDDRLRERRSRAGRGVRRDALGRTLVDRPERHAERGRASRGPVAGRGGLARRPPGDATGRGSRLARPAAPRRGASAATPTAASARGRRRSMVLWSRRADALSGPRATGAGGRPGASSRRQSATTPTPSTTTAGSPASAACASPRLWEEVPADAAASRRDPGPRSGCSPTRSPRRASCGTWRSGRPTSRAGRRGSTPPRRSTSRGGTSGRAPRRSPPAGPGVREPAGARGRRRGGRARLAVVCTSGRPNLVTAPLSTSWPRRATRPAYHGDFDWPGVAMANDAAERWGAVPC